MTDIHPPPRAQWWKWTIVPLRRYARFEGRSAPLEFWMYSLFLAGGYLGFFALGVVLTPLGGDPVGIVIVGGWTLFFLANFIPGLALTVRRLHDLGLSGHWIWAIYGALLFFSILAWIAYLVVMSLPGNKVENRFGPPVYGEDIARVFS